MQYAKPDQIVKMKTVIHSIKVYCLGVETCKKNLLLNMSAYAHCYSLDGYMT